jgi:hypothetical protein
MAAGDGVVVVVVLVVERELDPLCEPEPLCVPDPLGELLRPADESDDDLVLDRAGVVRLPPGAVEVEVEVEVVVWLEPPGARGAVETNSVVAVGTEVLVPVVLPDADPLDVDPPSWAAVSWSSAAFSDSCAWSTAS